MGVALRLEHPSLPFTFDVYTAEADGAWVVHVDTDEMECNEQGPRPLRLYINDGPAEYQNPRMPSE
jgi:hypothetical protein